MKKDLNSITQEIIGAAIDVHKNLGPGLLESVYQHCLSLEFKKRNLMFYSQAVVPIHYLNQRLNKNFVLDFLVENEVIVELKAVENIIPIHEAQLLTYLKLSDKRLGLLINFNVTQLTKGIKRLVNNY